MVSTIKFSEFAASNRTLSTNKNVGLSNGANAQADLTVTWTTLTRPSPPYNGLMGYNTDLSEYEFYDTVSAAWVPVGGGGGGSVTLINTGTGLTGGPISTTGTISFAAIAADSLWANITGSLAVPTVIPTATWLFTANNLSDVPNKAQARINLGLQIGVNVEAWSAALDSIAGLTTVANELIYTTASNTYSVISPLANAVLITSGLSVPSWDTTLPSAVQSNITHLGAQSQALNMNNHQINNVTDPTNPQDAATMAYVTAQTTGMFLPLIGGTMSGIINMGNHKITNLTDPSSAQDAVTVTYLNAQLANYLPLSGGTMTGAINMGSFKITNLLDPTNPQDAATKNYVDLVATGLTVQPACYAATTANLTAIYVNGASGIGATLTNSGALAQFMTDGTTPPTNARILVWQQSSTLENGIYTLTNQGSGAVAWILTRSTDYDQPAEIQPGDLVIINNGTLYGGSSFIETASVSAVGTDPILFSQFTFSASAVLLKANNLSDVANKTTSFNNISPLTTNGDLIGYNSGNVRVPVGMTDGQVLQVSSGAGPGIAWSTATYPVTTTVNEILYSSATNVVSGIATLAGGVLVTDNSSVPQFLTNPGAAGKVLQSANAAIPSWSTPTYPSASGTLGKFLISDGTNNVYSTSTIPTSAGATAGKLLASDGTNYVLTTPSFPNASATAGKIIISDGVNWIASTSIWPNTVGTALHFVLSDGTSNVYSTPAYPNASVTAGKVIISDGTNYIASTSIFPNTVGSAGKIIRSDGTINAYSTATFADTYTASNLLYSNGSNTVQGLATANSAVLVTGSTGVPVWSSTMTNGQLIIGSTGATPAAATLTAGTGISITNAAASITIAVTGAATSSWVVETTTSRTLTAFQGVITNNAGLVTLTVPATTAVGDIFEVSGLGAGGWKIQFNTGQVGHLNSSATTSAGSFASTNQYNTMRFLCVVANTTFVALSNNGNITVA